MHSREEIPVDSVENATSGKLKKWKYLDSIAGDIAKGDKVSVYLLIGACCIEAMVLSNPKR